MRLKFLPFLISLALLAGLIALLPLLIEAQESVSASGTLVGLFPGFGLGLALATCSYDEQAGSRGLLFVPLAALLGMLMAVLCWAFASVVGAKPALLTLAYGAVNLLGAWLFFAIVRKIYAAKLPNRKVLLSACASAAAAIMLLFFPLTPFLHGVIAAAWVSCVGLGIVLISGRRKRSARAWALNLKSKAPQT